MASSDPALAAYFAAVYGHQRALAGVVRRRMDLLAALAVALGLPENADRDAMTRALREALRGANLPRVDVEPADDDLESAVAQWHQALLDPSTDERAMAAQIDARHLAVRDAVTARLRPAAPSGLAATFDALVALLRDATATRACMLRLAGATAPPLQRGAALSAAHRELAAEFTAAETAVLGFHVRAARHAQESLRVAQWVEDALRGAEASAVQVDAGASPDAADAQ